MAPQEFAHLVSFVFVCVCCVCIYVCVSMVALLYMFLPALNACSFLTKLSATGDVLQHIFLCAHFCHVVHDDEKCEKRKNNERKKNHLFSCVQWLCGAADNGHN